MRIPEGGADYDAGVLLLVFASIIVAVSSVVAVICCCGGSSKNSNNEEKKQGAEDDGKNNRADFTDEAQAPMLEPWANPEGNGTAPAPDGCSTSKEVSAVAEERTARAPDTPPDAAAAAVRLEALDRYSESVIAGRADKAKDFSTIRNAKVNVKLAMATYETGRTSELNPEFPKSVALPPRRRLDAAFKDQIIIRPGKPNIQRHTVAVESFQTFEEGDAMKSGVDGNHSEFEARKVLPELLEATPLKHMEDHRLSSSTVKTAEREDETPKVTASNDNTRPGSDICSNADNDYFGVVQRQDVVLRTVEKVKAPHKHKKGKVPAVDGVRAAQPDGVYDNLRLRPHSSGDILD